MESYQKPNSSIFKNLLKTTDITILSKAGISNYYNNFYLSVIIHSILRTVAKYISTSSNMNSPILKVFDECQRNVAFQMVKKSNKRKIGFILSKQFKNFSECLMNYSLKLKEYHEAIEFCNNMSGYTSVDQHYLERLFQNHSLLWHWKAYYITQFSLIWIKEVNVQNVSLNVEAHKLTVFRDASPDLIFYLSPNNECQSPCWTPTFVPSVLCYYNLFAKSGTCTSYSLVSTIFCSFGCILPITSL